MNRGGRCVLPAAFLIVITAATGTNGAVSSALVDTLRDLLNQLEDENPNPAGAIAKVSGSKVYINLGADSGIAAGDMLEIVRKIERKADPANPTGAPIVKRDVAGRLKVVTVQEKLSICELVDGKAEERNGEGKLNMVVPPRDGAHRKVALGMVKIASDAAFNEQVLRDALASAVATAGWLSLSSPEPASEELSVTVETTPGGCSIELRLKDRRSGRPIKNARKILRIGLSAADYGFRSALAGTLGVVPKMAPVKKAMQNLGDVAEIGDVLVLVQAGSRGESTWVFPDSRIVVGSRNSFASTRQMAQLSLVWQKVGRAIDSVTAELSAEDVDARLRTTCEFFTESANQVQVLQVELTTNSLTGLVLAWPDAQSTWTELLCTGSRNEFWANQVAIDDKVIISNTGEQVETVSLGRLAFGEHRLAATRRTSLPMVFRIAAFFDTPHGQITLSDQAGKNLATRDVYSRTLGDLVLPGTPELLRAATQPSADGSDEAAKTKKTVPEREPPERLRERLEAARSFLKSGEYNEAKRECYIITREAPGSAEAAEARKLIAKINEAAKRKESQRGRRGPGR